MSLQFHHNDKWCKVARQLFIIQVVFCISETSCKCIVLLTWTDRQTDRQAELILTWWMLLIINALRWYILGTVNTNKPKFPSLCHHHNMVSFWVLDRTFFTYFISCISSQNKWAENNTGITTIWHIMEIYKWIHSCKWWMNTALYQLWLMIHTALIYHMLHLFASHFY